MKWISVKEKLPDPKFDWVLVCACGAVDCMGYSKKYGFFEPMICGPSCVEIELITHWMPLPEPPTGESDG
jgi:hypothetical protein